MKDVQHYAGVDNIVMELIFQSGLNSPVKTLVLVWNYLRLFHICDWGGLNNVVMVLYWTVFTSHKSAKGPLLLSKHWTCSPLHPLCRMWPSKRFQDFQTSLFGNSGVVGGDRQTDGRTDRQTDTATC